MRKVLFLLAIFLAVGCVGAAGETGEGQPAADAIDDYGTSPHLSGGSPGSLPEFPPTVVDFTPPDGATGVSLGASVEVRLSKPVLSETVDSSSFVVGGTGGYVRGQRIVDGAEFKFVPRGGFSLGTRYSVRVSEGIAATDGSLLALGREWNFTTKDGAWTSALGSDDGAVTTEQTYAAPFEEGKFIVLYLLETSGIGESREIKSRVYDAVSNSMGPLVTVDSIAFGNLAQIQIHGDGTGQPVRVTYVHDDWTAADPDDDGIQHLRTATYDSLQNSWKVVSNPLPPDGTIRALNTTALWFLGC